MSGEPGVVTRDGTILCIPVITQRQRNALWAQIVRAYGSEHPEIFSSPPADGTAEKNKENKENHYEQES